MTGSVRQHWGVALPKHWTLCQVKNVAQVTLGKMLQASDSGGDLEAPYLRAASVQPDGVLRTSDAKKMWFSPREIRALDLRTGDVVVVEGGVGGYGRAAYVTADLNGWGFQNSINRLRPRGADGRFIAYYLIAARQRGYIQAICNIVSMPHFTAEKLAAMRLPMPPVSEQCAIADYLDREAARIDALIAKQERLIGTLLERRAATIERALDSPAHLTRLRHAITAALTGPFGTQLSSDEYVNGGVPVINPTHIRAGRIVPDPDVSVTEAKANDLVRFRCSRGDILLGRKGDVDKSALVDEWTDGYICGSDAMAIRPASHTVPKYLWWFFQSVGAHSQLEQWSVGSTVAGLNQRTISKVGLPLPPLDEQRRIVALLDEQTAKIDALIAKAERFIEVSKERRSALITAAVTGQIDVRERVKVSAAQSQDKPTLDEEAEPT